MLQQIQIILLRSTCTIIVIHLYLAGFAYALSDTALCKGLHLTSL